jgi:phospholipid transport system substrate-binding protein
MSARISLAIALGSCLMSWAAHGNEPPAPTQVAAVSGQTGVAAAPPQAPLTPQQVVESLHAVLIDCMKRSEALGFDGRYELLARNLDQTFDIPIMARASIGKAWNELDNEQRTRWVVFTRHYSAANYADKFDGYSDQHFETLGEEPSGRGTVMVHTEFVQKTDDNVKFDYRLRKVKGGWRIIDVQYGGRVSELALRRADYRSVIGQGEDVVQGIETLIARLSEKIEGFERE